MNKAFPVRILYVDDDYALARLAVRILARSQFQVVHAPSIAAGLELFANGDFKAVCSTTISRVRRATTFWKG